jgi:hypothetical protein
VVVVAACLVVSGSALAANCVLQTGAGCAGSDFARDYLCRRADPEQRPAAGSVCRRPGRQPSMGPANDQDDSRPDVRTGRADRRRSMTTGRFHPLSVNYLVDERQLCCSARSEARRAMLGGKSQAKLTPKTKVMLTAGESTPRCRSNCSGLRATWAGSPRRDNTGATSGPSPDGPDLRLPR